MTASLGFGMAKTPVFREPPGAQAEAGPIICLGADPKTKRAIMMGYLS
jgi:hypothetical protein